MPYNIPLHINQMYEIVKHKPNYFFKKIFTGNRY